MKKSYDYFKTLKILSDSVSVIYDKTLKNEDFSSNRISFFAEKSELINNLKNEFITPLERGDIFLLAECLTEEVNCIFSLQEYFNLININDIFVLKNFSVFLGSQNKIFSQLKNFKSNLRLFDQCSEEVKNLNTEKKKTERDIVDALNCKSKQPLIKYAVYSSVLALNRSVYRTFLETEKILMNNS